jgi:hypothetical protein
MKISATTTPGAIRVWGKDLTLGSTGQVTLKKGSWTLILREQDQDAFLSYVNTALNTAFERVEELYKFTLSLEVISCDRARSGNGCVAATNVSSFELILPETAWIAPDGVTTQSSQETEEQKALREFAEWKALRAKATA